MTSHVDTALGYAQQYGWAVHPVDIKKKPTTKHGRNDATRDEQAIRAYFKNGAQIGVATGPESGLFVLDVDIDHETGINGYETLEYLESLHGPLPRTPQQRTGRGGMQYLFTFVDGLKNSAGKIGAGIDTRGQGGYIVVAPSHNTNGPYEWVVAPSDAPLAAVPQWLIDALKEAEQPRTSATTNDADRSYALKMLGQAVARVATASDGQKHDTLLKMARWMGGFVPALQETEIESALWSAVSLRAEDERGARKTIADGIAYGKTAPLSAPARADVPKNVNPETGEILKKNYVVDWRSQGATLADLQYKEFPPERWIIEGILPEGACLFAAKYKSKKSWLSLALGLAISMGGRAIGRLLVEQGDVLYLDLEGRQQRIQKRTRAMLGVRQVAWPNNFHVFTQWSQGDEGLADLEHWLMAHEKAALVIIDVLASFRRPMSKQEEFYRYDRDTVDPINALAEKYHVAILLVHHFNKGKHDDIMDSITGSSGLPSAVNTMWALRRDVNDSSIQVLELRGRDLENDEPLALKWDSYLNQHVIEGPAAEVAISTERKTILAALADDEPHTPKDIAASLGRPVETIKQLLRKLLNEGVIDKVGYGKYARIAKGDHSDHGGNSDHSDHSDHSSYDQQPKSDRIAPRVIGDSGTDHSSDHSVLTQQDALNEGSKTKSDRSDQYIRGTAQESPDDHPVFASVPQPERIALRRYLRGNKETDQEIARERCRIYGVNYDAALAYVRSLP